MEKGLLIIIAIMSYFTLLCSILVAIINVNEAKKKGIINKTLKAMGIVTIVVLICALAFVVPNIKDAGKSKNKTTTIAASSSLQEAGFNEVSLQEYLQLVEGSEKSIVLIARPTCGYCEKFAPVLKQAKEDMNLTVYYIDTDKLTSDNWDEFTNSVTYLKEEEWGTPTVLIVQNGDSVAENSGYVELDEIKEFFTKNGFGE